MGEKLTAVNTKAASCLAVNESLIRLSSLHMEDPETVLKELETFCSQLLHIQNSLSKALYFIPEYKEDTEKKEKKVL